MRVSIAVASRHGSTFEIAEALGEELRATGHAAEVWRIGTAPPVDDYEAVIIGSAIYIGAWLAEARQFVERHQEQLKGRPVWLFSSGPLGQETPRPPGDPNLLGALMAASGARGHRVFAGKLDKDALAFGERLITRMVGAPEGDFRDWEAARAWAREIASELPAPVAPVA